METNIISLAVVEDSPDTKDLLELLLSDLPDILFLGVAPNGQEGINLVVDRQPDVVIMDLGLPDISGLDCIKVLKPQCPQTDFIVFTTSEDDENVFDAIKLGATSYLLKNTDPEDLLKAIKEVKQGGSPISSSIARKVLNFYVKKEQATDTSIKRKEFGISNREEEVLKLLSEGLQYKEVAEKMFITVKTLKSHIYRIYEKLQVDNRVEAVNKFYGKYT